MGIEDRDYYREKFAPPKKRGRTKTPPRRHVLSPLWPKQNPRSSLPLRRPGTGQHVELAEMREELGHSEARGVERRSGPGWPLAAWTLVLAAVLALGGLAALLT